MDKSPPTASRTDPPAGPSAPPEQKSVAFSAQTTSDATANVRSPVAKKILERKPTPFNNDLAAAIRRSGFGAAVPKQHDESNKTQTNENGINEHTNPSETVKSHQEQVTPPSQ